MLHRQQQKQSWFSYHQAGQTELAHRKVTMLTLPEVPPADAVDLSHTSATGVTPQKPASPAEREGCTGWAVDHALASEEVKQLTLLLTQGSRMRDSTELSTDVFTTIDEVIYITQAPGRKKVGKDCEVWGEGGKGGTVRQQDILGHWTFLKAFKMLPFYSVGNTSRRNIPFKNALQIKGVWERHTHQHVDRECCPHPGSVSIKQLPTAPAHQRCALRKFRMEEKQEAVCTWDTGLR